jgi:hypothetical protein
MHKNESLFKVTAFVLKYKQDTINWSNEKIVVEYKNLWIWLNEIMRVC